MGLIKGNIVDLEQRKIYAAQIVFNDGVITSITPIDEVISGFILPGFIDAHVHIESSLLVPSEFARLAVMHGTVATVSDPHEIANVLGMKGVDFMIDNGKQTPFKFFFGAPSCVPATIFETAGDEISVTDIEKLLLRDEVLYLTEMMNFPGVIFDDAQVHQKIKAAHYAGKPVDGHAPGLRGEQLLKYFNAGITTDHECFTLAEAIEKLALGMHILIREGSAARNFDELIPAIKLYPKQIMFCSDDKHPDSLLIGHINQLCARAIAAGYNLFDVLRAACVNPVKHYKLPVGLLQVGAPADFIEVDNLENFKVNKTFINGNIVFDNGIVFQQSVAVNAINKFNISELSVNDFNYEPQEIEHIIVCIDGQLVTQKILCNKADIKPANDVLKIAVVNRYQQTKVAVAYIKNFGLKQGAIASSVAHDSHNIVVVGVDDESICKAVNLLVQNTGGLSAVGNQQSLVLPLPVAGLMSNEDAWIVAQKYTDIDTFSKQILGSTLGAPFMSLSFMALLVIPSLKLSDKGLFDGDTFSFLREAN